MLLLNGTQDRETSGFTASCFVTAIADALNRTHGDPNIRLNNPVSGSCYYIHTFLFIFFVRCISFFLFCVQPGYYINTLLVPKDGEIAVDLKQLSEQGIDDVVSISLSLLLSLCFQVYVGNNKHLFVLSLCLLQRVVETVRDPKHGVLFNPSSLINTLASLVE